jgi:hypothetical protein
MTQNSEQHYQKTTVIGGGVIAPPDGPASLEA